MHFILNRNGKIMALQCSEGQSFKALRQTTEIDATNVFKKFSARCGKLLLGNLCDFMRHRRQWNYKIRDLSLTGTNINTS